MSEIVEEDQDTGCSITHYTVIHIVIHMDHTPVVSYTPMTIQVYSIQEDTVKIV